MSVQIYGAKNCASCKTAKDICKTFNINHEYLEVDIDYTINDLLDICEEKGLALPKSFPFILDNNFEQITIDQLKQLV